MSTRLASKDNSTLVLQKQLDEEKAKNKPNLQGEIQLASVGQGSGNLDGATVAFLWVTIRNLGAASIVDNYQLTLEMPSRGVIKLSPTNFWGSMTLNEVVDVPSGRKLGLRIDSHGQLFEKTQERPIPTGD